MILGDISNFWSDLYRASILFSVILMLIFVIMLFQKKFRRIPAIYWGIQSFIMIVHFLFFAFWEYNVIEKLSVFLVIIASLRPLVMPFLFLAFTSHHKMDYAWNRSKMKVFYPILPLYFLVIPTVFLASIGNEFYWTGSVIPRLYFLSSQLIIGASIIYISIINIIEVKKAPEPGAIPGYIGVLKNSPLIGYMKYMSFFLLIHAVLIIIQLVSHAIYGIMSWELADQLEQYFWLIIGLIFVYKFISYPVILFQVELQKHAIPKEKYQGEMMDIDQAQAMIKNINAYMLKEKPFLNMDYSIKTLSNEIGIPSRELSKLMNQYLNQNFHDFINNYRVEEFKRLVQDPESRKYSILSLAMEAGFRSKSTFNTAFKKFAGETPSEYCKKQSCI